MVEGGRAHGGIIIITLAGVRPARHREGIEEAKAKNVERANNKNHARNCTTQHLPRKEVLSPEGKWEGGRG
jgi:hypothetical protein